MNTTASSSSVINNKNIKLNMKNQLNLHHSLDGIASDIKSSSDDFYSLSIFAKPPFLPKLPKFTSRLSADGTHVINDVFIKSSECSKLKVELKGDLLKGTQVFMAMKPNVSDTIKKVKTADSPWNAKNENFTLKPCKSAINRKTIWKSSFLSHGNSIDDSIADKIKKVKANAKNDNIYFKTNNTTTVSGQSITETDQINEPQHQFAENILNNHFKKSLSIYDINTVPQPDIAIHAFKTIWEFHSYALENSPFLQKKVLESQSISRDSKMSIRSSKTSLSQASLDKMKHIFVDIEDTMINKLAFAVGIGNLYHPDKIKIPGYLAGSVLAVGHLLQFEELKKEAVFKMASSLSIKTVGEFYLISQKYNEKEGVEMCEKWLEMNLVHKMKSNIYLRCIPIDLIKKVLYSKRFFTYDEYSVFITILNWIFLKLNPNLNEVPSESILITYYSSLEKEKTFIEKYPEFKELIYAVRLHGITKTNWLDVIEQVNIYPKSYLVKTIMEIQYSLQHGGDMNFTRQFSTSAIRHGFSICQNEKYNSQTISLYGFIFELIAEKISSNSFQFYIQRLYSNDPCLTYEQSKIQAVSLRNERFCYYSINLQYYSNDEVLFKTTGLRKHRFGKIVSQSTPPFLVELPVLSDSPNNKTQIEMLILYSLTFPCD